PHAVVAALGEPGLRLAVAQYVHHLEADDHAVAVTIAVTGGEVAIDAAADLPAFGVHADMFGHPEAPAGGDRHLRAAGLGALGPVHGRAARRRQQGGAGEPEQGRHGSRPCTGARWGAPAAKAPSRPKPARRATTVSGTRWVASL